MTIGYLVAACVAAVAGAVIARLARRVRRQQHELRRVTAALERERKRGASAGAAEERMQIARELHEIVARALSTIVTRSRGAEAALEEEPERARGPLQAIHHAAEDALGEMHRLLGVLDEEPGPGLVELPALIERARAAGIPVTMYVDGRPRPLPASVDLSAYRIVQEALANVRKHAGSAPATVHVVWSREALSLQVRDAGARRPARVNGDGRGLTVMRERVRLHDGELHAGPVRGGGFEVRAVLPL